MRIASLCKQSVDDSETRLDELFSQIPIGIASVDSAVEQRDSPPKRFGVPVSDEDIKLAQATTVPRNTRKCTVNVWWNWRANHCKTNTNRNLWKQLIQAVSESHLAHTN